jgi:hemerythrin
MVSEIPSVLLTYVTYHDAMAKEHWHLFKLLRLLLKDAEPIALRERQIERLTSFQNLLAEHHETENAMLRVVLPDNLEAHLQGHRDLSAAIAAILSNSQTMPISEMQARAAAVLSGLQHHVATLDRELAQCVDASNHT